MLEPSFEGPIVGFVINYLRVNYWRVQTLMEFEDAVQEAGFVFTIMLKRIGVENVQNESHLMALFKTAWSRHFITLSNKATKAREIQLETDLVHQVDGEDSELSALSTIVGALDTDGAVEYALEHAPENVRAVVSFLMNAPASMVEPALKNNGLAKGNSVFLAKMLGLDAERDHVRDVYDYFS